MSFAPISLHTLQSDLQLIGRRGMTLRCKLEPADLLFPWSCLRPTSLQTAVLQLRKQGMQISQLTDSFGTWACCLPHGGARHFTAHANTFRLVLSFQQSGQDLLYDVCSELSAAVLADAVSFLFLPCRQF